MTDTSSFEDFFECLLYLFPRDSIDAFSIGNSRRAKLSETKLPCVSISLHPLRYSGGVTWSPTHLLMRTFARVHAIKLIGNWNFRRRHGHYHVKQQSTRNHFEFHLLDARGNQSSGLGAVARFYHGSSRFTDSEWRIIAWWRYLVTCHACFSHQVFSGTHALRRDVCVSGDTYWLKKTEWLPCHPGIVIGVRD